MGIPAGTSVGPYQVVSQLGAGGMGEVYRARDPRLSREVALKVIRKMLSVGPDAQDESLDRLLREAILASALNHPNIVTIYETGVVDTDRYVAMELIDGRTLRAVAAQGLPVGRVIAIARQVSEALAVGNWMLKTAHPSLRLHSPRPSQVLPSAGSIAMARSNAAIAARTWFSAARRKPRVE